MHELQKEIKMTQVQAVAATKSLAEAAKEGKFSETLVRQLLRQGEDRKTTVEETRSLSTKL
jgi:hypothetical protein